MDELDLYYEEAFNLPKPSSKAKKFYIRTLIHVRHCLSPECKSVSCKRMKETMFHIQDCKLKVNGDCPICVRMFEMCVYHAKSCQEENCEVYPCESFKQKINDVLLRRDMGLLNISKETS